MKFSSMFWIAPLIACTLPYVTIGLQTPTGGNLTGTDVDLESKTPVAREALNVQPGDKVAIIAPSGRGDALMLPVIKAYVESLGLVASITDNIYDASAPFYSNSDEFRANDLISALLDSTTKVIWCIRGGAGAIRLIPYLEERLPATLDFKILIGFSDITVLHLYFQKKYGWQTIHGPMLESIATGLYDATGDPIVWLTDLIFERKETVCLPSLTMISENSSGIAEIQSEITGGNAVLVEASIGTLWQMETNGRIVFLEDTGEAAYSIERSLDHMKQVGIFNQVDAVIFGDFTRPDNVDLMNLVIERFAQSTPFPVFRVSGIGHESTNYPLPLSTRTSITRSGAGNTFEFCVKNIERSSVNSGSDGANYLVKKLIITFAAFFVFKSVQGLSF